jgi:hypothetical protein
VLAADFFFSKINFIKLKRNEKSAYIFKIYSGNEKIKNSTFFEKSIDKPKTM